MKEEKVVQIYEELVARGLIAQVTDEKEIRDLVNQGKATFYIGFDPTADSLHVGHFMALCLMKRMQQAGNLPIALMGGGTGVIGDPSGRSDLRKMMTDETIQHNIECFKKQISKFIDFSDKGRVRVHAVHRGRSCGSADRTSDRHRIVSEKRYQNRSRIRPAPVSRNKDARICPIFKKILAFAKLFR